MKLKTLLLLILGIFPIIVLGNSDNTPMTQAEIDSKKIIEENMKKDPYHYKIGPRDATGIKAHNFRSNEGKEKNWWNPFDKERKPQNPFNYSDVDYNELAIQEQKEDAESYMFGIAFWGGIFTIIAIIIRDIKRKSKDSNITNQNSSNLKDYLSYDIINLQNRENKLDEAFNNGILTPEEYKEKKEKLEEEKNILLKRQEQKKQLDALANLFHNGIITNEEYWIKKNQIINS